MRLCQEEIEQGPKVRAQGQEKDKVPVTLVGETLQIRGRAEVPAKAKAEVLGRNRAKAGAEDKARAKMLERAVVIDNRRKTIKKRG